MILAAGRSRRFGHANKLLAPLYGEPLLWRTLDAVCAARARPIVVVLGHQQAALRATLARYRSARRPAARWKLVVNRRYRSGLASSLQAGLAALPAVIDGAVICLGDMPGTRAALIERLRLSCRRGDDAVVPEAHGRRGNPVLLGRALFAGVREQLRGDEGARRLIARAAQLRIVHADAAALHDIDTRRAWRRLQRAGAAAPPSGRRAAA